MTTQRRIMLKLVGLVLAQGLMGCSGQSSSASDKSAVDDRVLDDLIQGLGQRDPSVRARSAASIAKLGRGAKRAVAALVPLLRDREVSVRAAAAHALGEIGPDARDALTELEKLSRRGPVSAIADKAVQQIRQ